jgi:hypothetical protein
MVCTSSFPCVCLCCDTICCQYFRSCFGVTFCMKIFPILNRKSVAISNCTASGRFALIIHNCNSCLICVRSCVRFSVFSSFRLDSSSKLQMRQYHKRLTERPFSQSELELLYDWRFTANQFVLAPNPLRLTTRDIFVNWTIAVFSPYVTSSLTRGYVCRLRLLLAVASAVIFGSESRGTHDHILLSQIRDTPQPGGRSPYLYPTGTGWPSYTPRHWVPFSSPPTIRRAAVDVFEPASTRARIV